MNRVAAGVITTCTSAPALTSNRTAAATLYAAMLPQTPTTTTRPRSAAATSAGASMDHGASHAGRRAADAPGTAGEQATRQHQERRDDLVGAPHRGIHDHVVPRQIGEVQLVCLAVAMVLAGFSGLDVARGEGNLRPIAR